MGQVDTRDSFDITVIVGDTFDHKFLAFEDDGITASDLTGFSAVCQFRDKYEDDIIIYDFDVVTIVDNTFNLHMTAAQTDSLRQYLDGQSEFRCVYDLQITVPNTEPGFPDGGIKSTPRNDVVIKLDVSK